ncbi:MAG: DNA mismatch repair endonuclease MutL [Bacteroidetes bacterium]|nr:DNA mismatch repair endonuclease MutL [Bacteroidota bacterium]
MPDFIRLLPDSVANQIAAGEVIQRPASAVKELMENAIDAGSTNIRLIIKDAGRTLIQVVDNGSGMSETDARMSFERHATSKIRDANDLFSIRTLGFRGEALASVAAVAQVELKTRKQGDEIGTCINIEGSRVKSQEEVSCAIGTSILVKNLFFNVPARRNFLKSDTVEFRQILEEFQRVSLVHPDIEFSLHHNDKPVFQLTKVGLKQRIVHVFGNQINEKLLPVEMKTEQVTIYGFIGKPETARKTRGEQYFFANGRFIRHPYLHHAVEQAFEELIPEAAYPTYFLFIEVDPSSIDVNIHPTKTEVNFQHGQLMYGSLRSAVKHALGMFSLSPTLDFETEQSFDFNIPKGYEPKPPTITLNPDYNPFNRPSKPASLSRPGDGIKANRDQWEKMYDVVNASTTGIQPFVEHSIFSQVENKIENDKIEIIPEETISTSRLIQVQNRYIAVNVKSGLMLVDQQKAHERILYERIGAMLGSEASAPQRSLFPHTIKLSAIDAEILREINEDLLTLGFDINELGGGSFVINSLPADLPIDKVSDLIDSLLEDFKNNRTELGSERKAKVARLLAHNIAVKVGKLLQNEEMQAIIDELFSCQVPDIAPDGSRILRILTSAEIEKLLR